MTNISVLPIFLNMGLAIFLLSFIFSFIWGFLLKKINKVHVSYIKLWFFSLVFLSFIYTSLFLLLIVEYIILGSFGVLLSLVFLYYINARNIYGSKLKIMSLLLSVSLLLIFFSFGFVANSQNGFLVNIRLRLNIDVPASKIITNRLISNSQFVYTWNTKYGRIYAKSCLSPKKNNDPFSGYYVCNKPTSYYDAFGFYLAHCGGYSSQVCSDFFSTLKFKIHDAAAYPDSREHIGY